MSVGAIGCLSKIALVVTAGMFGSPSSAQDGRCGTHTEDDLFQDVLGEHTVALTDGVVYGTRIADKADSMSLFRSVGGGIGVAMGGNALPRLEMDLESVSSEDALDFRGAGFDISFEDYALVSGCMDTSNIPQYFGSGYWLSADGVQIPATMRLFLWLGHEGILNDHGDSTSIEGGRPAFHAIGVVRSEVLNGKVRFY